MRFFDKYTGLLRRMKVVYLVNNLLNYSYLKRNKPLYRKYGVKRAVWQSLSSKHFAQLPTTAEYMHANEDWDKNGYIILPEYLSAELVDKINGEIQLALDSGAIDFNYTQRKILFAYEQVPVLKEVINHVGIKTKLEQLVGAEVVPFQSINFLKGSEQAAHSDSVHMASYPLGGLIAIWVALEDIDEQNGGLFYYPGSHKLPYATNRDIGNSTGMLLSPNPNKNYEEYLQKVIHKSSFTKQHFIAKKGDILIWHANLIHGGLPHLDTSLSRKSMVVHYFVKDRICYHELSQRPAVVKEI